MRNILLVVALSVSVTLHAQSSLQGAWASDNGVLIVAAGFFSYAAYTENAFNGTYGGAFHTYDDQSAITYEFNTFDKEKVGEIASWTIRLDKDQLTWGEEKMKRVDNATPGALAGPWLISGRVRDGEMRMRAPSARKTMKILSGTHFQWIAYNSETGEFFGTGGGTYTTHDGTYTENIEFFSRDQKRVGASLPFGYELIHGAWHHKGNSSQGNPMHEIWSQRAPEN